MKKIRGRQSTGKSFWDDEYGQNGRAASHLAISIQPSEDLEKFTRWMEREHGREYLNPICSVLDVGCGNGRNLIYLAKEYGMRGVGYDISDQAISLAKRQRDQGGQKLPLVLIARSVSEPLPLPDSSQTLVLDMMVSHFLNKEQRAKLLAEIARVLKPGGWFFLKTFLRDGDTHVERLIKEYPAPEDGSYIHPEIGVAEHVFSEEEIIDDLAPYFSIHKVTKSHRHKANTGAKRRSMSIYAQKIS